jgi:hypothetical protein
VTFTFTPTDWHAAAKGREIISSPLTEIGVLAAGENASAAIAAWGLEKLQRLVDQTNAREELIYNVNFSVFTLTPNHSPHTIGPGGDFNTPLRPVRIKGARYILQSSQPVDIPIEIVNDQWWLYNPVKSLTSSLSNWLYYSPDVPLGNCYFWPTTTNPDQVRLELWVNLQQAVTLDTSLVMPQGYWDWLVTELAIQLCPAFNKEPNQALVRNNLQALRAILPNNADAPVISTAGQGIPSGRSQRGRPSFNFLTGLNE